MSDAAFVGTAIVQAVVLALPVIAGGIMHVIVIKLGLFGGLARVPLDGGLTVNGRRLFGDNKTLRGALVMPPATALASWLTTTLALSSATLSSATLSLPMQSTRPALWGALLGLGYILGELPNSFFKRQLDVPPGDAGRGALGATLWVIDQVDFLVGIVVVAAVVGEPLPLPVLATLAVIALVVHPAVAALMVRLGLKRRVG